MKSFWQKAHKISNKLHLPSLPNWLCGLLALVLILRIPSFFEPYNYGDEMVYLTLGQGVRQGIPLYAGLHDNKPPLLYLTAAVAGNLFWFKVILAFWNLATIVLFYKLGKLLFKQDKTQKLATFIFAILTTIPLMEGNIANAELFMIGPSILAVLLLLGKNLTSKKIFYAGALFGIATLFKVPALFDAPVIVFYWLITDLKNWKGTLRSSFILFAGFLAPILLTFVWYYLKGILPDYIKAAFLQNMGYLSSFRPGDVQKSFIVRNAPLLTRALIVLLGTGVVFLYRKKLSNRFILFCVWTLFALFAITLSERPYPHYFIQALAPVSFLFAIFFSEKSVEQSLSVIPLAVAFFVPVYYKFWFYPTASYYTRFVNFATGRISKEAYFTTFSRTTNRNYQIAQFLTISATRSDRVFMWDPDSPVVYALARRFPPVKWIVPYHVHDFSSQAEVARQLTGNPPKFIILTSGNPFPELIPLIRQKYLLIQQIENANIFTRINLAP